MSDRLTTLIEEAGRLLKCGRDPLNETFLTKFDVTLAELNQLQNMIGDAIIGFARSSPESRMIDHLKAVFDDPEERSRELAAFNLVQASIKNRKQ